MILANIFCFISDKNYNLFSNNDYSKFLINQKNKNKKPINEKLKLEQSLAKNITNLNKLPKINNIKDDPEANFIRIPLQNFNNVNYGLRLGLGSPYQLFNLIVNSRSESMWVQGKNCTNCNNSLITKSAYSLINCYNIED